MDPKLQTMMDLPFRDINGLNFPFFVSEYDALRTLLQPFITTVWRWFLSKCALKFRNEFVKIFTKLGGQKKAICQKS